MLRWDLLAVLIVALAMMFLAKKLPFQTVAQIVPLMGVVVSIFIGFRNSSAYNRWWEARTLWGAVIANSKSISNALVALDNCTEPMAVAMERMRRRVVRFAWQLRSELSEIPSPLEIAMLTPEDPTDATSKDMLTYLSADIRIMSNEEWIDRQGRSLLVNLMTAHNLAAGGLDRIRNQPIPRPYALFIRIVAWLFAIMVCTRMDSAGHEGMLGLIVGVLVMSLFIIAERLGYFIEKPLTNSPFGLDMDRFCKSITIQVLGKDHPLTCLCQ